jgi:hypothetical protein
MSQFKKELNNEDKRISLNESMANMPKEEIKKG